MTAARQLRVTVVARAVLPLHGFGGLERSVRDLVRHLAASDVDVTLIVPPSSQVQRRTGGGDPFASPRIHLRHVNYVTFPFANRRGTTILDRSTAYLVYGQRAGRLAGAMAAAGQTDIVHGFGASVLGYARMRDRPAPLVLNPQGLEEFGATLARQPALKRAGYAPLRWAVRRCAKAANCVIATDVALEATVARHLKPAPGRMRTVPNGIDLVEVTALAGPAEGAILRQRHGIAASDFVIVSAGRLERNKGFADLAAALGQASASGALGGAGWHWIVAGGGPERAALEEAVSGANISAHTRFVGRVQDAELHAWYEAASVFAHPTRYEGSSLVTLEAMAHRCAIVATRAGGLPDKVKAGINGWLVEPGDIGALSRAIVEAATAGSTLASMGAASRELVEREFAWTMLAKKQIAIYEDLLMENRSI